MNLTRGRILTTWRKLISEEMKERGDCWDNVVMTMPRAGFLDIEFDDGFGGHEGVPFTLWTKDRVYFPMEYDGADLVRSAPRNPCDEAMDHV